MRRLALVLLLLVTPSPAQAATPRTGVVAVAQGKSLFAANCARCHGPRGEGVHDQGPSLRDTGALQADFYLRTGYMPLDDPHSQPSRTRVLFDEQELRSLVAYVASLGRGPAIPSPQWRHARADHDPALRDDLMTAGAVVAEQLQSGGDARVPPLNKSTPRQIAEAVRSGPYLMPRFSTRAITPTQLNDIVAYVQWTKHPYDRGGWGLGHLGPWPEGMVTWLLAASILVAMCVVIGRRVKT